MMKKWVDIWIKLKLSLWKTRLKLMMIGCIQMKLIRVIILNSWGEQEVFRVFLIKLVIDRSLVKKGQNWLTIIWRNWKVWRSKLESTIIGMIGWTSQMWTELMAWLKRLLIILIWSSKSNRKLLCMKTHFWWRVCWNGSIRMCLLSLINLRLLGNQLSYCLLFILEKWDWGW